VKSINNVFNKPLHILEKTEVYAALNFTFSLKRRPELADAKLHAPYIIGLVYLSLWYQGVESAANPLANVKKICRVSFGSPRR
jgi:hypothetical protein